MIGKPARTCSGRRTARRLAAHHTALVLWSFARLSLTKHKHVRRGGREGGGQPGNDEGTSVLLHQRNDTDRRSSGCLRAPVGLCLSLGASGFQERQALSSVSEFRKEMALVCAASCLLGLAQIESEVTRHGLADYINIFVGSGDHHIISDPYLLLEVQRPHTSDTGRQLLVFRDGRVLATDGCLMR